MKYCLIGKFIYFINKNLFFFLMETVHWNTNKELNIVNMIRRCCDSDDICARINLKHIIS